jgi:deoxyribonuclease IV
MFGSHLSVAGGLHNALLAARSLQCDCVQVFTKNQRQWRAAPLARQTVELWSRHWKETGIGPAVSHDSYLINLAAPDGELRDKSIASFTDELERCEALAIPFLVTHPGAHVGQGPEEGLRRVVEALDRVHGDLPGFRTITCLEITAGQGTCLGHRLEQLKCILESVRQPERLAVCIDTAHSFEAGYDLRSAGGTRGFLQELDQVIGLNLVRVLHVNDSKTPFASRVDRHAHIGHGHIPLAAFEVIVNHPGLRQVPKILETPKETAPDGREWDEINLQSLRDLVRRRARRAAGASR